MTFAATAILQSQTDDDEEAEENEEADQGSQACPIAAASEAVLVHDRVDFNCMNVMELGNHQGLERVPDRR